MLDTGKIFSRIKFRLPLKDASNVVRLFVLLLLKDDKLLFLLLVFEEKINFSGKQFLWAIFWKLFVWFFFSVIVILDVENFMSSMLISKKKLENVCLWISWVFITTWEISFALMYNFQKFPFKPQAKKFVSLKYTRQYFIENVRTKWNEY